MKTNEKKLLLLSAILCLTVCCVFIFLQSFDAIAFAYEGDYEFYQEQYHFDEGNKEVDSGIGIENYVGYGCDDGIDLSINASGKTSNYLVEGTSGFGCGSSCGSGRENGFSSSYLTGCRNWQQMPIIGPMYKYWIDESTLTPLSTAQRAQFIANVDAAAALWNSMRMHDGTDPIVALQKMSSNGIDVVPVRYDAGLSNAGEFNPIPLFHEIKLRIYTGRTPLHEFGHMLGLQDLDMNNDPVVHRVLMGYLGSSNLQYQDIQGLAVANSKHKVHDFKRYYVSGSAGTRYKSVCFYCDLTDTTDFFPLSGSAAFVDASTCSHDYKPLVSADNRHWHKCTSCYKVIESPFLAKGINNGGTITIEITGQADNRTTIEIPRQIGGQNVTHIGSGAFSGRTNITTVTFQATSNVTTIGNSAFSGLTQLSQISMPDAVTTIGGEAFSGCEKLTGVQLPKSLTTLRYFAFAGTALTTVTIPSKVTAIGANPFLGCASLTSINVASGNSYYTSEDSVLYNKYYDRTLISYPAGKTGTAFTVPDNVKTVGQNAFSGNPNLKTVNLNGVETVEQYAFSGCTNLTTVSNGSVKTAYYTSFSGTAWETANKNKAFFEIGSVLLRYNGTSSFVDASKYTSIADFAFAGNQYVENIVLDEAWSSLLYLNTFAGCSNLQTVTLLELSTQFVWVDGCLENLNNLVVRVPRKFLSVYESWYEDINFEPISTTVHFISNGVEIGATTAYFGDQFQTAFVPPQISGKDFNGWFSDTNCTETFVNNIFTETASDVNLYALWEQRAQYTLLFNSSGGAACSSTVVTDGSTVTLPTTKNGDNCGKWSNGSDTFTFGQTIVFNASSFFVSEGTITFTAQWHSMCIYKKSTSNSHTKTCFDCGTSVSEWHTWAEFPDFFQCIKCGYISKLIPIIRPDGFSIEMQNLFAEAATFEEPEQWCIEAKNFDEETDSLFSTN